MMKQGISIILKRQGDSLVRLTGLLYRRGYVIESLSVGPDSCQGHVQVTAVVTSQAAPRQLYSHVSKLVDVVKVEDCYMGG
ncbi:ACT domain-containing protein [Sporomusa sp.]|uniref:ACT domain-containing protein n=1 Tax=Sporomusa sp. TaxID=2078658 RepID=UPI002B8D01D9|nr:ACT domain-containing protein [Sporomusa sp.]HWR08631.1 ACT domain-containing protein [Sporomusa sp.]